MNIFLYSLFWLSTVNQDMVNPYTSYTQKESCPKTVMLNTSKFPWVDYDYEILDYSKKRCGQMYQNSPCVKLFKKYNKQQYSVICGSKK